VESFLKWMQENHVHLCACTMPMEQPTSLWVHYLQVVGFHIILPRLHATLDLQDATLTTERIDLRRVELDDLDSIESIAGEAFPASSYYKDALFPRNLAEKGYRQSLRQALAANGTTSHLYVTGEPRSVRGFVHFTTENSTSDLCAVSVAPDLRWTGMEFDLYVSVLHILRKLGIKQVMTNVWASDTTLLNMYVSLGFSALRRNSTGPAF
jgi:ribosomal protein S18 acetylase RimI-like enzyme